MKPLRQKKIPFVSVSPERLIDRLRFDVPSKIGDKTKDGKISLEHVIKEYLKKQFLYRDLSHVEEEHVLPSIQKISKVERVEASVISMKSMWDLKTYFLEKFSKIRHLEPENEQARNELLKKFLISAIAGALPAGYQQTQKHSARDNVENLLASLSGYGILEATFFFQKELEVPISDEARYLMQNVGLREFTDDDWKLCREFPPMQVFVDMLKSEIKSKEELKELMQETKYLEKDEKFGWIKHIVDPYTSGYIRYHYGYAVTLLYKYMNFEVRLKEILKNSPDLKPQNHDCKEFMEFFLREWHMITADVDWSQIPEFMYMIDKTGKTPYGVEVLNRTTGEDSMFTDKNNFGYFPVPVVNGALDQLNVNNDRQFGISAPNIQLHAYQSRITGGICFSGSQGVEDYPRMDILNAASHVSGGSEFIQAVLERHLEQCKKAVLQYEKERADEEYEMYEDDTPVKTVADSEDSSSEYQVYTPTEKDIELTRQVADVILSKGDIVRDQGRSYVVVKISKEQQSISSVEDVFAEYPFLKVKEGLTLMKVDPRIKHVGWKKIEQILIKHFNCEVGNRASSHVDVKRIDEHGEEHNGTILSPKNNHYSKNAAFGTLFSSLKNLGIHSHDFWDAVHKKYVPEKIIALGQEEYRKKMFSVANKLSTKKRES